MSQPVSAATEAGTFEPIQAFAPASVIFDDPTGKGFVWDKALPCGVNRATVTLKFHKAYVNEHKLPVAKVWLHTAQTRSDPEQWIAAAVKAPTDTYRLNALEWLEKDTDSENDGPGYAPADLTSPLQIEFAWTPDGVVSVNFGGEFVKHIRTSGSIDKIGLAVSWAKFEFVSLKVGRAGAPQQACATQTQLATSTTGPTGDKSLATERTAAEGMIPRITEPSLPREPTAAR
jgi:hypothetical protein